MEKNILLSNLLNFEYEPSYAERVFLAQEKFPRGVKKENLYIIDGHIRDCITRGVGQPATECIRLSTHVIQIKFSHDRSTLTMINHDGNPFIAYWKWTWTSCLKY